MNENSRESRNDKDISRELIRILRTYKGDRKQALKEHVRLDYLYALSDQRENLVEWYPFRGDGCLLEAGSGYGALTGVYSRKVAHVDVLDESEENLEVNRLRHVELGGRENIRYVKGNIRGQREDGPKYDYIVFAGSLGENAAEEIRAAKALLKPGGEILAAACNPFGLKYWAGAEKDPYSFSKEALIRLLSETGDGRDMEFYYPMPDYRIPVTIFSDNYLPGKGDLTDTVTAYDYPGYLSLDIGAAFDAVCEDGQFDRYANAYLAIWRQGATAAGAERGAGDHTNGCRAEYIKYNRTRKEEFQIRTAILGKPRRVEKTALVRAGMEHIASFEEKCRELNRQHRNLRFARPGIKEGQAGFPYIEGETLAQRLGQVIGDGKAPVDTVGEALEMILEVDASCYCLFEVTSEFTSVFGELPDGAKVGSDSLMVSNIDMLFENILLGDGRYCLDYEWVFFFPVPV